MGKAASCVMINFWKNNKITLEVIIKNGYNGNNCTIIYIFYKFHVLTKLLDKDLVINFLMLIKQK